MSDIIVIIFGSIIVFCISILIAYPIEYSSCKSKWKDYETSYGWLEGCLVKNKEGKFIPSENYREFN